MKKSYYNFIFKNSNGTNLAFNSRTCALAEVEEDFFYMLENIENIKYEEVDENKKELITNMKDSGFIIEDCYNEFDEIKYTLMQGRFNQETLNLIIAPTLNCNFKCLYCYETCENTKMTKEVQESLVSFVKQYIPHIKKIRTVWYGGEPLLCKDIIINLSEKLMNICNENNLIYNSYMITNGYMVDDEIIDIMKKYKISGAQITLDGPPEIHNKRRVLKSGREDNFEKVFNAISKLHENQIQVHVRVNIDKNNIKFVDNLLAIFKENDMTDVFLYFGKVAELTEACKSISNSCYNTKDFSKTTLYLQKKLIENGFKSGIDYIYYPSLKSNYCSADQINSFVIDPNGYLYKCMGEVGNKSLSIGNIKEELIKNQNLFTRFLNYVMYSPFDSKECSECRILPICMGGCPSAREESASRDKCTKWKYNLKDIIEYAYECNKEYPDEFQKAFE